MAKQDESPTIALTLGEPKTLAEVEKWAAVAALVGIPSTSTLTIGLGNRLTVTAYLAQIPFPEEEA